MKVFYLALLVLLLNGCEREAVNTGHSAAEQPFSQMLVYPVKKVIEPFRLLRHDQTEFSQSSFTGRWNLMFMGYTNCPDVCPMTMMDMANIYKNIAPDLQEKFQIVFLSVDPGRDTLPHMADYMDHFHRDFVGITGDKDEIDKLVQAIGGIYALNSEDENYYSVDHSARIFIISPQGERYGIITSDAMHRADKSKLIDELNQLAKF
jgi:protein SCO1